MPRITLLRTLAALALLTLGLGAFAAGGPAAPVDPKAPPAKPQDDSKSQRFLYLVKNGSAKDLVQAPTTPFPNGSGCE